MICGWGATTSQPANQRNAKIFHIWRKEMDLATEMAGKASVSGLQHCAEIYAPLAQHTTRPMKWQHCSSCSQRSPATTNQSHALDHKYKSTKYNGFYSACAFVCMCVWKSFLVILYFWLYPWSAHYPFTTLACKFVRKCVGEPVNAMQIIDIYLSTQFERIPPQQLLLFCHFCCCCCFSLNINRNYSHYQRIAEIV